MGFENKTFIPVVAVFFILLFITVWFTTKKLIRKRILVSNLKLLRKNCNITLDTVGTFPEELNNYLGPQLEALNNILTKLDKYLSHISRKMQKAEEFLEQSKTDLLEIQKNITEAEKLWGHYNKFIAELDCLKNTVADLVAKINGQTKALCSQEKEHADVIKEKANDIMPQLEGLITKYNLLASTPFADFGYNLVINVSKEYENLIDKADKIFRDLEQFDKTFQVYISGLHRNSTFYITLSEIESDSTTGKRFASKHELRNSERLGEAVVSYRTFKKAYAGKRYSTNVFITNKRCSSDQIITLKIIYDKETYLVNKEVELDVFKDILTELSLPLNVKDYDENGIPVDLHLTSMNIPICTKGDYDFIINCQYNFIDKLNIYELLEPEPEKINLAHLNNETDSPEITEEMISEENQETEDDDLKEEPLVS